MSGNKVLDRRYIFAFTIILVVVVHFYPIPFPVKVSKSTREFYDVVESITPGEVVLLSYDSVARQEATTQPAFLVIIRSILAKGAKVVFVTLNPEAPMLIDKGLKTIGAFNKYTYGEDFVVLGWIAGEEAGVEAFAADIHGQFRNDFYAHPVESLPMMTDIKGEGDIELLVNVYAVTPGLAVWTGIWQVKYKTLMIFYDLQSHITQSMPYVTAGIAQAALWGLPGTAEYELLTGMPGRALSNVSIIGLMVFVIVIAILWCNVNYYVLGKKGATL